MRRPTEAAPTRHKGDTSDLIALSPKSNIDACLARVSEFLYRLDTQDERDEHRSIPATVLERD